MHSLLVNLLVMLVLVLWRKPLIYVLALWIHQLCDRMWMRPWVAMWPFTGTFGYRDLPLENWVYSVLNPYNLTTEAIGLAVTVWVVIRFRLYDRRRLRAWLRTGSAGDRLVPTSKEKSKSRKSLLEKGWRLQTRHRRVERTGGHYFRRGRNRCGLGSAYRLWCRLFHRDREWFVVVGWRLHRELHGHSLASAEHLERRASRVAGALLIALSIFILVGAGRRLLGFGEPAQESTVGIVLTAVSLAVMPFLGRAKLKTARELGSAAMRADAY